MNAIPLYELRTIKPKRRFYTHVVFNSTYQVLTKFLKVWTKSLFVFFLSERRIRKTLRTCQKKTTAINFFILNIFLLFLSLKLCMISKAYLNRSFEAVWFPASRLHFLETRRFCRVSSACRMSFLHGIRSKQGASRASEPSGDFSILDKKCSFYETKPKKNIKVWHSFGKWPLLA